MVLNSPFTKTLHVGLPPLPLWSRLSELSEMLSPRLQSSFAPNKTKLTTLKLYIFFPIHSSATGHLGCFQVIATVNSAAMNVAAHVSLSIMISSVCMPSSGIARSYGSSISSF